MIWNTDFSFIHSMMRLSPNQESRSVLYIVQTSRPCLGTPLALFARHTYDLQKVGTGVPLLESLLCGRTREVLSRQSTTRYKRYVLVSVPRLLKKRVQFRRDLQKAVFTPVHCVQLVYGHTQLTDTWTDNQHWLNILHTKQTHGVVEEFSTEDICSQSKENRLTTECSSDINLFRKGVHMVLVCWPCPYLN